MTRQRQTEQDMLHTLIASPRISLYMEQIRTVLRDEKKKRRAFYDQINEDDKAEFINGEIIFHSPVKLRHSMVVKYLLALLDIFVEEENRAALRPLMDKGAK